MKAIPMRGRLKGKKIAGYFWAGLGDSWRQKENYFQLEDDKLVTAAFQTQAGAIWIRCKGASCDITLKSPAGKVLSTVTMKLPRRT